MSLFAELQRRNVFKVGAAYAVVAWLVVQGASIGFPAFGAPPWALRVFILVSMLGFPVALVMAWVLELTPDGLKVEAAPAGNKRMAVIVGTLIALALGWYILGQRLGDSPATDLRSIAVLPFVNMSADPEQEYFSDGIAEELLNRLAQIPDLKVAARTSAFQFKGRNLDIAKIAETLNVATVLEGSVRKDGARLKITAQLIDARTGYHLWSQAFERDASDVFRVQEEIATAIASALRATLGDRSPAVARGPTVDPAAYDEYLKARALVARRRGDSLQRAVEAFDRAIALDPAHSAAHSGRAFALVISPRWKPWLPPAELAAEVETSCAEARGLDSGNAETWLVDAIAANHRYQTDLAGEHFEHALALAPGSMDAINFHSDFLMDVGDLRRAEQLKRRAMDLDPLAFVHPMGAADVLTAQGRFAEALAFAERAHQLDGAEYAQRRMFWAQLGLRQFDAAERTLAVLCAAHGAGSALCHALSAALHGATGATAQARAEIRQIATGEPGRPAAQTPWFTLMSIVAANSVEDIPQATVAVRELAAIDGRPVTRLLAFGPNGALLPEEISQDPEWLAAWSDPRLRELMHAFRTNLTAFREGR